MKRIFGIVSVAGWLAGAAFGGVTLYEDNFNDGVRNKALWTVDNYFHGKFVETGGRLYGTSGVLNPLDDYHAITWLQKPALSLVNHDILEVEALLRLPLLNIGSAPDAYISQQIGFTIPGSIPKLSVFLWFTRTPSGHHFNLDVYRPDQSSIGYGVIPPSNSSKYYIRMRYNTATGSLTLYSRERTDQPWNKLKRIDLNGEWDMAPGAPVTLQAFLNFASKKTRVDEPNAVYFDNFKITRIRP